MAMIDRHFTQAVLLALWLTYITLPAVAAAPPSAGALPEVTVQMQTGVRWCRGAQQGLFRVMVAPDDGTRYQQLTIQVLQSDLAERTLSILDSVPITETQGQRLIFEDLRMRPAESYTCDDALIEGNVLRDRPEGISRERLRLRFSSSGQYSLRFLPAQ
jgi:hypothetical protein